MKTIFPLSQVVTTNVLRLVGLVGVVTATAGMVIGLWALNRIEAVLDDTLQLATTSLDALKSSSGLADASLDSVRAGLDGIKGATSGMDQAFVKGEKVLGDIGRLVENDISTSVRQFDGTLPGLVQVAKVVDGAVQALNQSPLNLPLADSAFSDNLTGLQERLIPIADNLKTQGKVIQDTAKNLRESGENVVKLNQEVSALSDTVAATEALLQAYDETLDHGVTSLRQTQESMKILVWVGRVFVVILALSYAGIMVVPLQISAMARASLERRRERAHDDSDETQGAESVNRPDHDLDHDDDAECSGDRELATAAAEADPDRHEPYPDLDVGPEANAPH